MNAASKDSPSSRLDKKRTVLLLRSVVVVSTSYLILFGEFPREPGSVAYILALILTNVILAWVPAPWFHRPAFSATLLLGDTAVVLTGLYLTVGCFSQDFLIIYFFTIFLTTATSNLAQIAIGAAMISGLYGYWLWLTATHPLGTDEWLRLPFFFIVAVFYAFMTEDAKVERLHRERAEHESERLRFLLSLATALPQRVAAMELLARIGEFVEAAFPRLRCRVGDDTLAGDASPAVFPVHSHGTQFGALQVLTEDGSGLSANESAFCNLAASIAANALHTAEQIGTSGDMRLKDEFLATLSHELRSPLHVILGNTEIVSDALAQACDPFVRESVDRLRANACRLLDLIEQMLCFAELRAGKSELQRERVDLRVLLAECEQPMRERLAGRPIAFEWHAARDLAVLYTDPRKLRVIVNALLSNATKFTDQGFIRISAARLDNYVELVVHDSGIGIHSRNLRSIFEPFRQIDGSLTRRFQGLGLGLALAQELAAALGGVIEVESEPERGSLFRLRLPVGQEATETLSNLVLSPAKVQ